LVSLPYRPAVRPSNRLFTSISAVPNQDAVVWYLRVEQERRGSVMVLTAAGRVSRLTCRQLETALAAATDSPVRGVVLDLSGVDYVSSPGLRTVESASTRLAAGGRRLVVCGVSDAVGVAFDLAGLGASLAMEPSLELALEKAGA
jgi:anti-anti-sigma factor